MKYIKNKQSGFSLIEMSVVVAVLSLVIAYMLTIKQQELKIRVIQANADETIEEIRTIGKAAGEYFLNHTQVWPSEYLLDSLGQRFLRSSSSPPAPPYTNVLAFCQVDPPRSLGAVHVSAIEELLNPREREYFEFTNPTISPSPAVTDEPYLSFIDGTSPYNTEYKTYCTDKNFYIVVDVEENKGDPTTSLVQNINELQAQYIARQIDQAELCSTALSTLPAPVQAFCGDVVSSVIKEERKEEKVVIKFNRPEGWFSLTQFLRKQDGGAVGGDIQLLGAGETVANSGIVGKTGGADIILNDGTRLQEILPKMQRIVIRNFYTPLPLPLFTRESVDIDYPTCTPIAPPSTVPPGMVYGPMIRDFLVDRRIFAHDPAYSSAATINDPSISLVDEVGTTRSVLIADPVAGQEYWTLSTKFSSSVDVSIEKAGIAHYVISISCGFYIP